MRSVLAITDRYSTDWCRSSLDDWEKCYGLPHSSITSLSKNEKNSGISLSSPSYSLQTLRISALKIHWKKSGIQGADFLSSWVRDQAMTERHARRNLDACSKRLRGNWKFGRFGDRLFPEKPTALNPKFRLNASTTERSTLRLQLSCSRSCEGEEIWWANKTKGGWLFVRPGACSKMYLIYVTSSRRQGCPNGLIMNAEKFLQKPLWITLRV